MYLRNFFTIVSSLALTFFSVVSVSAADRWISVNSPNFKLVGNADELEIRRVAEKLEQFRFVFTQKFAEFKFVSPIQTTVIVFKDEDSFRFFKPLDENGQPKDWVKGFFQPDTDVNYIALTAVKDKDGDFTTIFHEYVHFLVNNTLGKTKIPPWLNEGLAEYFEQFQIDANGKAVLGRANQAHLLRLKNNGLMPLNTFLSFDYYTLNRQSKEFTISFYAQAWILLHYLIHERNIEISRQIKIFTTAAGSGKSFGEAFSEAFKIDYATAEKNLREYVKRKNFAVSTDVFVKIPTAADVRQISTLSPAEAEAFQGDLLLHENRLAEAGEKLETSLSLDSKLGFANTSYGLLKWKTKNYLEARKYLSKGIAADSADYFAYYSFAAAMCGEGITDYGLVVGYNAENAEKIRENLRKAISLNADFAESYQLFAFIDAARNENLDEGIEMINKALAIAPGNQLYNLRSAELYLRKQKFSTARNIIEKILQTAADDQMKLSALNTLNEVNSWENQLREIEESKRHPLRNLIDEQPILSEEEIQKLNARAMLESLNQALRKPKSNEKRLSGFIEKVECQAATVIYTVKSDDKIINFQSAPVENINLVSFTSNFVNSKFGCNLPQIEKFAVITYLPNADPLAKVAGNITAVEFVPESFVFIDLNTIVDRKNW